MRLARETKVVPEPGGSANVRELRAFGDLMNKPINDIDKLP